jgi:hypothetical protein
VLATNTTTFGVLANDSPGAGDAGQPIRISAVTQGTKGRVTTDGTTTTYDPLGCATGMDVFDYTITDGVTTDTASAVVSIARPTGAPITDTPAAGLVSNSTIGSTVPLKVSWCGVTASPTTVRSYKVVQSTNGGSTYPTTLYSSTTGTSSTRNVAVGTPYAWGVRTVDSAGRTGAYRASLAARVGLYQESSTAITYAGAWGTTKSTSFSGGAERWTKTAGATATITLTNVRQFAVVGPRSSRRGSFGVYVDGALVATVSEKATSTVYRRVLYVRSLTAGANVKHTIQLKAVGNGQVDLDAILALS